MQRSLRDDVKSAFGVFLGVALGGLVFDPGHPELLLVSAATVVVVTAVMNLVRQGLRRREP